MSKKYSNFQVLISIWRNINKKRKFQFTFILFFMILSGFAESFSIGSSIPFLGAITDPDIIINNNFLNEILSKFGLFKREEIILFFVLIFGTFALLSGFIRIINLKLNLKIAALITSDLSVKAYRKTLNQDYENIITKRSSDLISSIITETNQLARVINYIMLFLTSLIIFIFILVTLFLINFKISFLSILIFIVSYLSIALFAKNKLAINSKTVTKKNKLQMKALQEGIGSIKEVLLRANQKTFIDAFRDQEIILRERQAENAFLAYFPRYLMESVGLILISLLAYILIKEDAGIKEVLPTLGVIAIGAQRLIPALQQIYVNWAGIKDRSASVESIINLVEMKISNNFLPNKKIKPKKNIPLINLNSVSYKYKDKYVLKDINLEINKNDKVGIIGETGSGKSTLIEILVGLLHPTLGQVSVNNEILDNKVNGQLLVNWRSSISYVPQNIFLSDISIKENIAFGKMKEEISFSKVKLACKAAHINKDIEKIPFNYDALVGERGISLSGGQGQRIGIARALYEGQEILFLDEATSSIDILTEEKIMDSIEKLFSDKTIIMITHRLSSLKYCNKVFEIKDGRIYKINSSEFVNKIDSKNN